jgi:hypothetical protein
MVVAAPTFLPEFRSSYASGIPGQTPSGSGLDQGHLSTANYYSLPLCYKNDRNVFNHIPSFFSICPRRSFVLNTFQALFTKTGVGYNHAPKIL